MGGTREENRPNEGSDTMAHVLPERASAVTRLKFWRVTHGENNH